MSTEGVEVKLYAFKTSQYCIQVSGHIHLTYALPPGEDPSVFIMQYNA